MKVKLPAEEKDFLLRPGYITYDESGAPFCENRYVKHLFKFSMLRFPWLAVSPDDQELS